MMKRPTIYALVFILIIIAVIFLFSENDPEVTKVKSYKPISASEKFNAKQFWHGKTIKSLLSTRMEKSDINRHLYILQAIIRQIEVYEKCAQVGADLTSRAIEIESKAIGLDIPGKLFIEGQASFIQNDTEAARGALSDFLEEAGGESNPLRKTTQLYLDALDQGVPFMQMFTTPGGDAIKNVPGCIEDANLSISDLLSMDFNVFTANKYDCGEDELCKWEIPDLSVYPYLRARLLLEAVPYTHNKFSEIKPQEQLIYDLMANIVEAFRLNDTNTLEPVVHTISEKGLATSKSFTTPYQIAHSLVKSSKTLPEDIAQSEPLTLLRIMSRNKNNGLNKADISEIYNAVLPSLFNSSLNTEYRDYVYVELWNFLWANDKVLLEQFRLSKGYSPGVVAPDFFLDLLPYRVSHPKENRLGNKDLKTQVQHHPYLRPLIGSYEYISENSKPDNTGKTGVG